MIAVYGSTGFIGSNFLKSCKNCRPVHKYDIHPPEGTKKIVYLISTVDNYNVLLDPLLDINTNLIHLMKVLDSIKNKDIEFTFVSSWFVYGDTELPAKETSYCNPKGFYSITKRTAEQLIESYCKTFGIKYKIVRLSNVIGKGDGKVSKKKNALQYLVEEMKANNDINLYHGGNFYRDIVHVDDAVDGIRLVMDKGEPGEIYNLGSGSEPILFRDVVLHLHATLNSESKIGSMEPTDFHKIVQVESMYLDTTKIQSLGFKPSKTIIQAIHELV